MSDYVRHPSGLPRQRGVAAVEFAIVLVPLLVIAFGAAEYGRAIYQYNTLVKSVRSAVRLLSVTSPQSSEYEDAIEEAQCMAVYGNASCKGSPLAPGLTTTHVKVCDKVTWSDCGATQATYGSVVLTGGGTMDLVAVRISGYTFQFIGLPFVTTSASLNFGPIEAVMRQGT